MTGSFSLLIDDGKEAAMAVLIVPAQEVGGQTGNITVLMMNARE